jgi:N-acylglucosamine-6-phosphate 2-epimerase
MREIDELMEVKPEIIAMDATNRMRPNSQSLTEFFKEVKAKYPNQIFMADTSCFEEGVREKELGFDIIGTTLSGYTEYTKNIELPNYELMKQYVDKLDIPIIAEGGIWTPDQLKFVLELGVWSAVVGTAITRPKNITERFVMSIK